MNVWALNKDIFLKHLLLVLYDLFGPDSIAIADEWNDMFHAVGLGNSRQQGVRAYVFTYGQQKGRYGVQLEFPVGPADPAHYVSTEQENLILPQLIELLRLNLELGIESPVPSP